MDLMDLIWVIFVLYILDEVLNLGLVKHFTKKGKTTEILEAHIWALQEQVSMLDNKLNYHAEHHNPHGKSGEGSGFTNFTAPAPSVAPKGKKWMSWDDKRAAGLID